jgi:hypothetical protein
VRLDSDQDRLAVEEDLIGSQDAGRWTGLGIEGDEHSAGLLGVTVDPAGDGGAIRSLARTALEVGSGAVPKEDNKDFFDLGEAEAQGVRDDGQVLLGLFSKKDGGLLLALSLGQLVAELLILLTQAGILLKQLLAVRSGQTRLLDGLLDEVGVLVGGLAGATGLLRRRGHVAVLAEEDGEGIAQAGENG